jgi:hypothetical protein
MRSDMGADKMSVGSIQTTICPRVTPQAFCFKPPSPR